MKGDTFTVEYLRCPHCGKGEHRCGHIGRGQGFGPWFCKECGGAFTGQRSPDGTVSVALSHERAIETMDLLVLPPQDKPVFFVVRGTRHEPQRDTSTEEDKQFLYEEHSCPVNWLRPEVMSWDGDDDPHGLIKFVATLDSHALPAESMNGPSERDFAIKAWVAQYAHEGIDRSL